MELFETDSNSKEQLMPLAERCRPKSFKAFVGQSHLVGEESPVLHQIEKGSLRSLILWGPPGTGKTTLAHLMAKESGIELFSLNAISSGVQDVRKVIEKGKTQVKHYGRQVILFIDEIHRFNKSQQDSLLHAVEHGDIVLIGATTENPSFEVNPPLLSRCQVLKLKALSDKEIETIIDRALAKECSRGKSVIELEKPALNALIKFANGDARIALNILERSIELALNEYRGTGTCLIQSDYVQKSAQKKITPYDKKGDYHYDVISAFIKSIRGSDPDAALFYLAVMLEGGEDIKFIARRLVILASEDVGNADPQALTLATSCLTAIQNIGMPEARIILAQATTYLASAPKSNASYLGIKKAMKVVQENSFDVPFHIRNAPTKLMKDMGYGREYRYPHDFGDHFVKQDYLPESVRGMKFYLPTEIGQEKIIKARLSKLWDVD